MDSIGRLGLLEKALEAEKSKSPDTVLRRTQIIKIVLAGARYRVLQCKRQLLSTGNPSKEAIACFQDVESVVRRLWQVDESGSPSKSSIKALQVFAQSLSLLDNSETDERLVLGLLEAFATRMVGCGADPRSTQFVDEPTWLSFPFSSSWQDDCTRSLSLRVHNLCVANSVALFSGWEENEFTLDLMKRKRKNNYFGITLNEGRIVGYLDADSSRRLAEAWLAAAGVVGTTIDVADSIRKAAIFLHDDNHVARPPIDGEDIAIYGEKDALAVFLEYAKRCLLVASATTSKIEQSNMIQIAMSVLLPVTQFSVLDALWDSPLGRATGSLSGLDEWRTLVSSQPIVRIPEPPGPKPLRKQQKRSINQWHQTELSLVARIVVIPIKFLLAEWSRNENAPSPKVLVPLLEHQSKLHDAMCQLRMCTTELTLQKASLQVTLILLDMLPCVCNPFLVMQQAALFASQCSKGGSMDIHFKTELPPPQDCDPMQALTILARAECLQAVHFSREATYLCSYVVRCCRMRRDESTNSVSSGNGDAVLVAEQRQHQGWTGRWKLIGIHAYNLAMATRSTICATQYDKDSKSKALEIWDDEVLGELERCRSDAIAMRKATVGDHDGEEQEEDVADDDADGIADNGNGDAIDAMDSAEVAAPESVLDSEDSMHFAELQNVCLGDQDDFVEDDDENDGSNDDCFNNDLVDPIEIVEV
ncbi:hypothetical protein MHU86_3405 [Fragilaria crotonensis]|nr:hypothetical protein MHU86_3405 [Fragilaria crotonensis]